jgi:hypothetical protein
MVFMSRSSAFAGAASALLMIISHAIDTGLGVFGSGRSRSVHAGPAHLQYNAFPRGNRLCSI